MGRSTLLKFTVTLLRLMDAFVRFTSGGMLTFSKKIIAPALFHCIRLFSFVMLPLHEQTLGCTEQAMTMVDHNATKDIPQLDTANDNSKVC